MRRIIPLICFLFVCFANLKAQSSDDDVILYKVTNYTANRENLDELALEEDIALAFLYDDEGNLCFANLWRNSDSFSHGRVYAFKKTTSQEENNNKHKSEEYLFTWKYMNSYDDETGEASVRFTRVFIGSVIKFQCEIVSIKDNSTLVLKGYLEK